MFLILPVNAAGFDVLVLPVEIFQTKENYYGFDEVSEIVAADIISNFNKSKGKIKSPDLYEIRAKLSQEQKDKQIIQNALNNYRNNNRINYDVFRILGSAFDCKFVLIVSASAVTNKNSLKRSVWEVLEVATEFNAIYPYRMETSLVLLDTDNNSVMWSNNYSYKLGANDNIFAAKNYAQANGEYEKIKLYSSSVVAPSASQNIILRFYPKSIKPLETKVQDTGGALRYDSKSIPEPPKEKKDDVPYTGDLLYDF